MLNFNFAVGLKPAVLSTLLLFGAVGCSSLNLGEIDETPDHRDDMPGPGILSNEQGVSSLTWETSKKTSSKTSTISEINNPSDRKDFELFKQWKILRSSKEYADEYQEFLLWLEFQRMKKQP